MVWASRALGRAALEFGRLWLEEKHARGEVVTPVAGTLLGTLELPDHALQGA